MKFVITRVRCKFSNGTTSTFNYEDKNIDESNSCNDINEFKKQFKKKLNDQLNVIGVTVTRISLDYYERDGRK